MTVSGTSLYLRSVLRLYLSTNWSLFPSLTFTKGDAHITAGLESDVEAQSAASESLPPPSGSAFVGDEPGQENLNDEEDEDEEEDVLGLSNSAARGPAATNGSSSAATTSPPPAAPEPLLDFGAPVASSSAAAATTSAPTGDLLGDLMSDGPAPLAPSSQPAVASSEPLLDFMMSSAPSSQAVPSSSAAGVGLDFEGLDLGAGDSTFTGQTASASAATAAPASSSAGSDPLDDLLGGALSGSTRAEVMTASAAPPPMARTASSKVGGRRCRAQRTVTWPS